MNRAVHAKDIQSGVLNRNRAVQHRAMVCDAVILGLQDTIFEFVRGDAHLTSADVRTLKFDGIVRRRSDCIPDDRPFVSAHSCNPPGFLLSLACPFCVHNLTERKENLATHPPHFAGYPAEIASTVPIAELPCALSNTFQFGIREHAKCDNRSSLQFVGTSPDECAPVANHAPHASATGADLRGGAA